MPVVPVRVGTPVAATRVELVPVGPVRLAVRVAPARWVPAERALRARVDRAGPGSGGNGTGGAAGSSFTAEPISSPPSYSASLDNSAACGQKYATAGFAPADPSGAKHPLFLYFVGTVFVPTEANSWRDGGAPRAVTEAMARRGFVALSVQYDNGPLAWLSDHGNQLACLFAPAHAESLIAAACSLGPVDCDLGIGVWGHSQGGLVADMAANYDPRVRAAWTTGYGGDVRATLSKNRLRVVNGESDTTNGTVPVLNEIAGFTSVECPITNKQCLRSDGSGWIIVQKKDVVTSSADHCWFDKRSCTDATEALEPNWIDPASVKPFALRTNADWVAETARRP